MSKHKCIIKWVRSCFPEQPCNQLLMLSKNGMAGAIIFPINHKETASGWTWLFFTLPFPSAQAPKPRKWQAEEEIRVADKSIAPGTLWSLFCVLAHNHPIFILTLLMQNGVRETRVTYQGQNLVTGRAGIQTGWLAPEPHTSLLCGQRIKRPLLTHFSFCYIFIIDILLIPWKIKMCSYPTLTLISPLLADNVGMLVIQCLTESFRTPEGKVETDCLCS